MQIAQLANNPFALLLHPEAVLAEIERSGRLSQLSSRICRPLDKPLIPATTEDAPANLEVDADCMVPTQN